ncbi:MAG: glycosyltransferase family 4 protein [Thermoleophilaceae bacterium]
MHVAIPMLTLVPGKMGGSETLTRGLVRGLSAAPGEEDRYTVVAEPEGAATLEPLAREPVEVRTVPFARRGGSAAARLASVVRARYAGAGLRRAVTTAAGEPIDVVHYALTVSVPELDLPRVVTVFDLQHELMPEFFSMAERAYRRVFYAGAIARADAIVTISEFSRQTIVERHGVDPERVVVAYQDVDRELFRPGPVPGDESLLAPLRLPERFVFYPANIWPHKNHERLIDAFAQSQDRELTLVLSGQDHGKLPELMEHAGRAGVADRVMHAGYVERAQLPAIYRRAVGVVFPSLFEGLGIPPLEAQACGCQVAAARVASLPEVLGERALWFDPRDTGAIAGAIDALAAGHAPSGTPPESFWSRFNWEAAAADHRRAYRLAAGSGAGTRMAVR